MVLCPSNSFSFSPEEELISSFITSSPNLILTWPKSAPRQFLDTFTCSLSSREFLFQVAERRCHCKGTRVTSFQEHHMVSDRPEVFQSSSSPSLELRMEHCLLPGAQVRYLYRKKRIHSVLASSRVYMNLSSLIFYTAKISRVFSWYMSKCYFHLVYYFKDTSCRSTPS